MPRVAAYRPGRARVWEACPPRSLELVWRQSCRGRRTDRGGYRRGNERHSGEDPPLHRGSLLFDCRNASLPRNERYKLNNALSSLLADLEQEGRLLRARNAARCRFARSGSGVNGHDCRKERVPLSVRSTGANGRCGKQAARRALLRRSLGTRECRLCESSEFWSADNSISATRSNQADVSAAGLEPILQPSSSNTASGSGCRRPARPPRSQARP
jgi:hypothetical protein